MTWLSVPARHEEKKQLPPTLRVCHGDPEPSPCLISFEGGTEFLLLTSGRRGPSTLNRVQWGYVQTNTSLSEVFWCPRGYPAQNFLFGLLLRSWIWGLPKASHLPHFPHFSPRPICRSVSEDFCCINFGGFSRGFSWRIFLGTFSHKNEEKKSGEKIREKIRRPKNKNPRKIRSAKTRP